MPRGRSLASLLVATLAAAHVAAAQSVRGTVRESGTDAAIGGAVVWLSDSAGVLLARSIADAEGRFAVARLPATARLHVLHIGFRPVEIAFGQRAGDPTADDVVDVQMSPLPLSLATVEASTRRVCPGDKGTSEALDLWQQARAALLASVVAREASPPRVHLVSYARSYEPIAHTLVSQSMHARDLVGYRSYVAGRSPWAFSEMGYMSEDRGGARTFYAPDAEVMLDPSFAGTHCMHVVAGSGPRQDEVGLGFEPVLNGGRDTLVEVSGVLWLDSASATLRSMEFQYVGLEPAAKHSGGEIFFSLMPNGAPMIDHWTLHFPTLAQDIPLYQSPLRKRRPPRPDRRDMTVQSWREVGGAVAVAEWPDGMRWHSPFLSSVRGQVRTLDGRPVTGADIWLQGGPDTTRTDVEGYFTLDNVFPGRYSVKGADSVMARVGFSQVWGQIVAGGQVPVAPPLFFYADRADVMKLACFGRPTPPGTGILLGRVVDKSGDAVTSAEIKAYLGLRAVRAADQPKPSQSAEADQDGRFALCGVPPADPVRLVTASDAGEANSSVTWNGKFGTVVVVIP